MGREGRPSTDVWTLAPGVSLRSDGQGWFLHDEALDQRYPVNRSAQAILSGCDGKTPLEEWVSHLSKRFRASQDMVRQGALHLLWTLNAHDLAQPVAVPLRDEWAFYRSLLARLFGWPVPFSHLPQRRLALDMDRGLHTLRQVAVSVWLAWRLPLLVLTPAALALTVLQPEVLAFAPVVLISLFLTVLLHETAHLIGARLLGWPPRGMYVAIRPGSVAVKRKPGSPRQELLIGVAGPVFTAIPGIALLWANPGDPLWLVAAAPFLAQTLTLLPAFTDSPLYPYWRHTMDTWQTHVKRRVQRMRKGAVHMIKGAGQVLLALVGGTFLTYVGLFILGLAVTFIGDFAGWPSFQLAPGGVLIYRFQAGENASFFGEWGEGALYLAVIAGVLNAGASAWRLMRHQPKGPSA
ncbi:MAG: hypothetical protein KM310_03950 [Clostridiales bacterium]|nr:hypothetical protein [Clostridiales bacterium]